MNFKTLLLFAVASAANVGATQAADYYASPDGTGDGTSASSPMNWAGVQAGTFANGDAIYLAAGTYKPTAAKVFAAVSIIGATDGRSIIDGSETAASPVVIRTAAAPEQNPQAKAYISNVDFVNYRNEKDNNTGALRVDNTPFLEVMGCNFSNNSSTLSDNGNGGGAVWMKNSNCHFIDCSFTDNHGHRTGGAVRITSESNVKGYATFERCYFANNTVGGEKVNGAMGGAIAMTNGQELNLLNCTFAGNKAEGSGNRGGAIAVPTAPQGGQFERRLNLLSCTIAGNESENGEVMINAATPFAVCNSIIVAKDEALALSCGESPTAMSIGGANVIGKCSAEIDNEAVKAENTYASVFGTAELATNGTLTPSAKTKGALPTELQAIADAWYPTADGATATVYAVDAKVDQLGNPRSDNSTNGALAIEATSGISSAVINGAQDRADVYNMQGIRVAAGASAEEISNLPAGIYIVNGKKVAVR
ncbi:MAG: right-handed parallel beta-helix repeat-containing protein [Clostridium sp.]|nr:right-handed parallel beta-helix repeat-containing protein [Clostridium sp.]